MQGWLLTDALEIGNCPVGNIGGLIEHAFSQTGCPSFTLEARVTRVPLPGAHFVTLDPDVCMFDGLGRRACDACEGTDKTGEMNTFQLVQKVFSRATWAALRAFTARVWLSKGPLRIRPRF